MGYQISLRAARINRGLKQREVSKSLGVCEKTICNWETGRSFPPADMFLRLCDLYGISIDNIFIPKK